MILSIIAMDDSWESVYNLGLLLGYWDEIEVIQNGLCCAMNMKEYSFLGSVDLTNRELIIACMTPSFREEEYLRWKMKNANFATLVHPDSYIGPETEIGAGSIIYAGAIISTGCKVAENVVVSEYSNVPHDGYLGKHSVLMEHVTMGGTGKIGDCVLVKAHSVIKENIQIGSDVVIEYGSVVLTSIAEGQIVSGNPARVRKELLR